MAGEGVGVGVVLGVGVGVGVGVVLGVGVGVGVGIGEGVGVGVIPLVLVGRTWRVGAGVGDPECDANNPGRSRRDSNTMTITNAPRSNAKRRFLERDCG